jgi:copper homeostasis protein CutC
LEGIICPHPSKSPDRDGVRTAGRVADPITIEKDTLLMTGRQAELVNNTLNSSSEGEIMHGGAVTAHQIQHLSEALGLVTHHWHDIECLAAWLMRQHREVIPTAELTRQIVEIRPEDHGLFP